MDVLGIPFIRFLFGYARFSPMHFCKWISFCLHICVVLHIIHHCPCFRFFWKRTYQKRCVLLLYTLFVPICQTKQRPLKHHINIQADGNVGAKMCRGKDLPNPDKTVQKRVPCPSTLMLLLCKHRSIMNRILTYMDHFKRVAIINFVFGVN